MRRVDIAYLYEHASRELDVACAVSARLRKDHGLSVQILHWPQGFSEAVASLKPRLVTLPFCYSERSYVNLLHFWNESLFFNLTWEQLLYPGNQKAKTPRGEFALRHVVHHAWSEAYADLLRDQGIPDEHIFCNGQPAYALYDEPYRRYFPSREELAAGYGLDKDKRWIFFPENYNWAFYSDATLQRFLADGQSLEDITQMRDFCNRSLRAVLNWCRTAAMQQDVEIILRPRPSTTLERFRQEVEQNLPDLPAGLHMIQDESVREWILASDVVISSHSTSLIEAAVAGKQTYILEPFPMPAPLRAAWHVHVARIKDMEAFASMCRGTSDGARDRGLENWARATLMSSGDSIGNLAAYLARLVKGEVVQPPSYLDRRFLTPAKRLLPRRWWALYRRREGRTKAVLPVYVKDVLSAEELESRLARWGAILA